jgi:uncharacterized membrane protein
MEREKLVGICFVFRILEFETIFGKISNDAGQVTIYAKRNCSKLWQFYLCNLYFGFHIRTVHLDIIKVLFIHQLMH